MSHNVCKIERLANGYEVELTDPQIVKENQSAKLGKPWKDPKVCYAFKSAKEVVKFLSKHLETALPLDEYSTSFDKATEEEDDD